MAARREIFRNDESVPKLYLTYPRKLGIWFDHLNKHFDNCFENAR